MTPGRTRQVRGVNKGAELEEGRETKTSGSAWLTNTNRDGAETGTCNTKEVEKLVAYTFWFILDVKQQTWSMI